MHIVRASDDQSPSDEDVLETIVSKPLSEEEIIPMESLRTHDSSLSISSKIDSLLDEFAGELTLLKSIPPGIDETDCDFEEDIRFIEILLYDNSFPRPPEDSLLDEFAGELTLLKSIPPGIDETDCDFEEDIRFIEILLYDNSFPRPPEEFVSANSDAATESFSPSPILVKDNDSLIEEIDLFCTPDYPMPPGIVDEDYDSKRDILIPKDLPSNNSLSFAEKESFHFDIPPFSLPPAKPLDGDTGILNIKMMGDISDQKAFMHKLMITLASHQEKSPDILSHRCGTVKTFNTHRSHLNIYPMLINGQNNPPLDVLFSEVMEIVIPEVGGIKSSNDNPIPFYDPIISRNPSNLTPSGESDLFLEVNAFLAVEDEFTSSQFPKSYLDPEGDMLLFEAFLNDDHSSDFQTKSSSNSLNSLLEETNNFHNSLPDFTTFSNDPFRAECEFDSSDDQSCSDEDVLEKIILKPLSEEEIIPMKSLHTHDSSLPISSKIDSLLDEFAGELTLLKSIPPGIDETDCDFKEDIHLIKKLLYDNSSPCPPEEFVSANSDAKIKSFSPSPILVKDIDSLMEEIDLFCTSDYPMPPGIVDKDYDSERDILIPKDLPSNNTLSFGEKKSFHFDIPPFSRPPAKPPNGDTRILNIKMTGDIFDQKSFMHKLMITLAPHHEKSPDLLSYRCGTVKKFNTHRSHLNKCPMLIHGQNNPPLDVLLFHFYPLDSLKYGGIWSSSFDLKQALRGRTPMLIFLGFFFLLGSASVCLFCLVYVFGNRFVCFD
nr:hypothetical protein [Tanacetum cinerariifolium]